MSDRNWVRLLFVLFMAGLLAQAALSQEAPRCVLNPQELVPQELRWALYVTPTEMWEGELKTSRGTVTYTAVALDAGGVIRAEHSLGAGDFLRQTPEGEFRTVYSVIVFYRFDPSRQTTPKEPATLSEGERRWLASEPVSVTVLSDPVISWARLEYGDELVFVYQGLLEGFKLRDELNKQKKKEEENSDPRSASSPVRSRAGPFYFRDFI